MTASCKPIARPAVNHIGGAVTRYCRLWMLLLPEILASTLIHLYALFRT